MLELLREQQRESQVTKQQNGTDQRNCRNEIHRGLPQLLTGLDVKKRHAEENYREQQHRQILHRISRNLGPVGRTAFQTAKIIMADVVLGCAKESIREA